MQQISITPGILILAGNKQLEIIASVSSSTIQARDIVSGEAVLISPGDIECELKRTSIEVDHDAVTEREPLDIGDVKDADLQLASRRFSVLSSLAGKKALSKQDIEQCTAALGLSASQLRRLFARLDLSVGPLSLLQRRRGQNEGCQVDRGRH